MSNSTPYKASLLSLYKNIMSLHRRKLPEQLRAMGDDYVRAEFKAIKKAKKAVFVEEFMQKWNDYADTIRTQNDRFGMKMKRTTFEKLDSQQQEQLKKLKSAALAAAAKAEGINLGSSETPQSVNDEIFGNSSGKL